MLSCEKNGEDVCLLVAGIAVPAALPWCCCVRPAASCRRTLGTWVPMTMNHGRGGSQSQSLRPLLSLSLSISSALLDRMKRLESESYSVMQQYPDRIECVWSGPVALAPGGRLAEQCGGFVALCKPPMYVLSPPSQKKKGMVLSFGLNQLSEFR